MIKVIALLAALHCAITAGSRFGADEVMSHVYPHTGIVSEVNYVNNTVTVRDFNGHEWAFYGAEDWQSGDICAMIMDDNGTEMIYDDIIMDVRYCGH